MDTNTDVSHQKHASSSHKKTPHHTHHTHHTSQTHTTLTTLTMHACSTASSPSEAVGSLLGESAGVCACPLLTDSLCWKICVFMYVNVCKCVFMCVCGLESSVCQEPAPSHHGLPDQTITYRQVCLVFLSVLAVLVCDKISVLCL